MAPELHLKHRWCRWLCIQPPHAVWSDRADAYSGLVRPSWITLDSVDNYRHLVAAPRTCCRLKAAGGTGLRSVRWRGRSSQYPHGAECCKPVPSWNRHQSSRPEHGSLSPLGFQSRWDNFGTVQSWHCVISN